MSPLMMFATSLLILAPPVYGILVVLFDTRYPPHQRNILALGGGILLKIYMLGLWWGLAWLVDGTAASLVPLAMVAAAGMAVYQGMQTRTLYR